MLCTGEMGFGIRPDEIWNTHRVPGGPRRDGGAKGGLNSDAVAINIHDLNLYRDWRRDRLHAPQ